MMPNPSTADLATTVKQARTAMTTRLSTAICKLQQQTTRDREAKGPMWVSRVVLPAPREDDARQTVCDAIKILGGGDEQYICPTTEDVRAQWVGHRAGVSNAEHEPVMSEAEKFRCLMREVECRTTLLYMHGGGHLYASFPPYICRTNGV